VLITDGRRLASESFMSDCKRIVYVLKNEGRSPTSYTSLTSNLHDRLDAHNAGVATPRLADRGTWT
jgi:predicted GIY-YIG superfamily endonuclease